MPRKTGYLAALTNVPPLIFRFQFNPDMLSDRKSFKYTPADSFGEWGFDKTKAGAGVVGSLSGLYDDLKDIGSLLVGVKPLRADEGGDRVIAIDFALQAGEYISEEQRKLSDEFVRKSIEPDLAVLRSFMLPAWDMVDVAKMGMSLFTGKPKLQCWSKPPECSLSYGGLSLTCVMTDLNIKITAFTEEGEPERAEVSLTLKEQPYSVSPIVDFGKRMYNVGKSYSYLSGIDALRVSPAAALEEVDAIKKAFS